MKSFASDNYSGVAPEIMQSIIAANQGHAPAYGNDSYTQQAEKLLQETFGGNIKSYFVYNGTAANTLSINALIHSYHAIICSDISHLVTQEVGAATCLTGSAILVIPHENGKITATAIKKIYEDSTCWGRHASLPKLVSIAQPTEVGTVYTLDELKAIAAVCQEYKLFFHMDGSRLANAAAYLNCSFADLTQKIGLDALSCGGTKNGLLYGEVIIFFKPELAENFEYQQKQNLQLNSKMRFISAQFIPYLKNDLWHRYAQHANEMCQRLANGLTALPGVRLAYPVQTNQIFIYLPESIIEATQKNYPFYLWDKKNNLARLVTTFDSTEQEVDHFIELAKAALG